MVDLVKRILETFNEMKDLDKEDVDCYTVSIEYDDGEITEFSFTQDQINNMSQESLEQYLKDQIKGNYH